MTKTSKRQRNPIEWKQPGILAMFGVLGVLVILSVALAAYAFQYKGRIYPNTTIGTTNFGGKTKEQAEQVIKQKVADLPKEVVVTLSAESKTILKLSDINPAYDSAKTAESLFRVGRTGSLWSKMSAITRSLWSRNDLIATFTYDEAKAHQLLAALAASNGTPAQDAAIVLQADNTVSITPAKEGLGVTTEQLESALLVSLGRFDTAITLANEVITPKVRENQAAHALTQVQTIIAKTPLTLVADEAKTTVESKTVFSWIAYDLGAPEPTPAPTSTVSGIRLNWPGSIPAAQAQGTEVLIASIDEEKVRDYLATLAVGFDREPQNAELDAIDGVVKVTKPHVDGQKLKRDEAIQTIVSQLTSPTATGSTTITLPIELVEAKIKESSLAELGIKELIGRAETNFRGSPANRIHNITTGARFLDGTLIPPGEEFSTVKTLGQVDGSTGYLPELVIKENRTIPEFGGGLCQVSTTLFRSVLNAGLKVTARRNHSYRVSYYEPPVGLDATIYLPGPDFKFLNDTPGYILVQNRVQGTKITFELYGTRDGRTATVSDPVITDIVEPPEPLYVETDTLFKGETKQIEKAHQGATAVATYVVMKDGKEINRQVFRSKYKAWQAQYLVGTKEPPAPAQ